MYFIQSGTFIAAVAGNRCWYRRRLPCKGLVHCRDIERSPLLPLDDGGQRRVCRFNILPGSPSIRFAALALSSYRGHRAATHHAQHAPCDLSPASGPLRTGTMCACVCLRVCASDASHRCHQFSQKKTTKKTPRPHSQVFHRWLLSPDDAGQFRACNISTLPPAHSVGYAISFAFFFSLSLHVSLAATAV